MAMMIVPSDAKDMVVLSISKSVGVNWGGSMYEAPANDYLDILLLQYIFRYMHHSKLKPLGPSPSMDGILGPVTHYHVLFSVMLLDNNLGLGKMMIEPVSLTDLTVNRLLNSGPMGSLNTYIGAVPLKDAIRHDMPFDLQEALKKNVKGNP